MEDASWLLQESAVAPQLKRFIAEKCAQVRAETRAPGHAMVPECKSFFTAAENGDWRGVDESLAAMYKAMREGCKHPRSVGVVYPVEWAVVNEIGAALQEFAAGGKYAIAFGQDIIASIPPGSIYFGGTDPGRFLVTALCASHVNGDPFFTLTQNALIDHRSYLRYVRGMYGSRIYVPTDEDATHAMSEYQEDARARQKQGKLLPGEFAEDVGGKAEFRGQLSVMAINAKLTRLMFEKNPGREFYIEESFPLEWMYPHLSPHGLILKINRQPVPELSSEILQRDAEYWTRYLQPLIGGWLQHETALEEVVSFAEQVFLRRDAARFNADRQFVENDFAQRAFSKLRASIGGLYAWRAQHSQSQAEKEKMLKEAEFAFRQAFVLCPSAPEAVFRYITLLVGQKRWDDAILVTQAAVKLEDRTRDAATAGQAQEDFSPKPLIPSQSDPGKLVTQLGNLLEQLQRRRGDRSDPAAPR